MLVALHSVDYMMVTIFLGILVVIGLASRQRHRRVTTFLLGDRSLAVLPTGLSLAVSLVPGVAVVGTHLGGLSLIGLAGQGYEVGLLAVWILLAIWLAVPLAWWVVLPIYQGLGVTSVYEYLELRFDPRTRTVASLVFIMWRAIWLAGLLAFGCQLLVTGSGLRLPIWLLILCFGTVATCYTFLGGIRAVVQANAIQLLVIGITVAVLVCSNWMALDGGSARVSRVASSLGRIAYPATVTQGEAGWTQWGLVPAAVLSLLTMFVADQVTLQRLLAVKDTATARRTLLVGCTALTVIVVTLTYLGLALLAFFHDHPEGLRARWVVNVDPTTRRSLDAGDAPGDADGGPPWRWNAADSRIDAGNIERLVEQRQIVRPNSRDPVDDVNTILDDTGPEGLRAASLLTRYPPPAGLRRGEVVLHSRANNELLPWYIATHLPWGLAGVGLVAIAAAILSTLDGGLLAVSGMVATHLGGSEAEAAAGELAAPGNSEPEHSTPGTADRIVGGIVLVLGTGVTLSALWMVLAVDLVSVLLVVTGTLGGPLLALFLLGFFTRRTNAPGAVIGLMIGVALTAGLTSVAALPIQPVGSSQAGAAGWAFTLGVALTALCGYVASLCVGSRPPADQLRGLVRGVGRWGEREREVVPRIKLPASKRWR